MRSRGVRSIVLVILSLVAPTAVAAQVSVSAFDWSFVGPCASGEVQDEVLHVVGPDAPGFGCGISVFAGFETEAPYAGTVFVRFDFVNHDPFFFVDSPAYAVDGKVFGIPNIGPSDGEAFHSMTFDVPAGSTFALGVLSADGAQGPAVVDYHDLRFFPRRPSVEYVSPEDTELLGAAVAALGDVDGDGVSDAVVGAPLSDAGGIDSGRVVIVSGADGSFLRSRAGFAPGDAFGHAVAGPGDLDGDDVPDVLVGAPLADTNGVDSGGVWVLSGADLGVIHAVAGEAVNDRFGAAVAGVGDVDGDDVPDALVGAPLHDTAGNQAGRAVLLSGADGSVLRTLDGAEARQRLGTALDGAGDVDGDGTPDLLLGAPGADVDGVGAGAGRALLVSGADGSVLQSWSGEEAQGNLGAAVAGLGDVDGDGVPDAVLGAPSTSWGDVRVVSGADGGVLHAYDGLGFVMDQRSSVLGRAVAAAGDVDDDGLADIAFSGRPFESLATTITTIPSYSVVFVVSGRTGELVDCLHGTLFDPEFAAAFDGLGDTDGDGFDDLVVGSTGRTPAVHEAGRAVVFPVSPVWTDLGHGLPGVAGTPTLDGVGTLAEGTSLSLRLAGAAPGALSFVILGFSEVDAPFQGGVLVPAPDRILALVTDGAGETELSAVWPASIPALTPFALQVWTEDAAAVAGYSATNGLRGLAR